MNLADVFTVVFIILGFLIVYISYWLMAAGLFPRFVQRCSEQIGGAPIKTALIGAITLIPIVAIGLVISNKSPNAPGKILGLAIALLAALVALFGSAGLAWLIGAGLKSARDEHEPWRRVLRGGIVLALTFVMPFLGTFLVMPLAFIVGFGAVALGVFRREHPPVIAPVAASVPPAIPSIS